MRLVVLKMGIDVEKQGKKGMGKFWIILKIFLLHRAISNEMEVVGAVENKVTLDMNAYL